MKTTLVILAALALSAVRADVTNVIDVVALGRLGTGVSEDGWQVNSVTNYSKDYKYALRFHKNECLAVSPRFDRRILAIEAKVLSSSQAGRRLEFTLSRDGSQSYAYSFSCPYSPSGKVATDVRFDVPQSTVPYHHVIIGLDNGGGTTAWGVVSLAVITADPVKGLFVILR